MELQWLWRVEAVRILLTCERVYVLRSRAMTTKQGPNEPCPCHSKKKYKKCCGPAHGGTPAPTPEALMRSRYSAYVLGLAEYVLDTTSKDSPHARTDRATG